MVYSRLVNGYGPYLYRSVREGKHVHSIYMGRGSTIDSGSSVRATQEAPQGEKAISNPSPIGRQGNNKMMKESQGVHEGWGEDRIGTKQFQVSSGTWGKHELKEEAYVSKTFLSSENEKLLEKYGPHPYKIEVVKTSIDTNADGKTTSGRPERQRIGSFYKTYDEAVDVGLKYIESK